MREFSSAFRRRRVMVDLEWIIAYEDQIYCIDGEDRPVTGIFLQGNAFTIDMPFDEFDKIFKESRSV